MISTSGILCNVIAAPPYGSVIYEGSVTFEGSITFDGSAIEGPVTFEGASGGKVQFGGKATFSCNSGFVLRGSSSIVCGGTSAQGTWSAARPTCQRKCLMIIFCKSAC